MEPIILLADSQLLFVKNENQEYYLKSIIGDRLDQSAKCAYIGASNGDEPEFYELFIEAMNIMGFSDCKMISSSFDFDEQEFLDKADLILLAGGDVERGMKVFKEKGINQVLQKKFNEGTIFIGVSAGAIQLGWQSFQKTEDRKNEITEAFKFIPFMVLVHFDEKDFEGVEAILKNSDIKRAYEIPFGAGIIYYPDHTVEAIRKPINEFILKEDTFTHTLIFPTPE